MWALWSWLSSRDPSQQLGKFTWSRREPKAHVGIVAEPVDLRPQLQDVISVSCGARAVELPAIIFSPAGNG
jgi:hypothetical protein